MSTYEKPQSPIYSKTNDAYLYPLTTVDQVIMEDGSRLNSVGMLIVDNTDVVEGEITPINADTLGGKTESKLSVAKAVDSDTLGGYSLNAIIDKIHPIDSVYTTSTNTNPSAIFGGTWELIDKEFAYTSLNAANCVTLNTTNCSAATGTIIRKDHSLWVNISFTPAVTITDNTLQMFTFNLSALGISGLTAGNYSSMTDAGQSVFTYQITASGAFSTTDIIIRASDTASLATGYSLTYQCDIPINYSQMLDSACNKFYWKRIA